MESDAVTLQAHRQTTDSALIADLRQLIEAARQRVATTANAELARLYWQVGKRLRVEVLSEQRAEYGRQVVIAAADELSIRYGKGFDRANLFRMIQFAEQIPDEQIVATLSQQLGWSHFKEILPVKDELARTFYAEMCRLERWSVRTLRDKINGMLYERTALSKKPEELIRQELSALTDANRLTPAYGFPRPLSFGLFGPCRHVE